MNRLRCLIVDDDTGKSARVHDLLALELGATSVDITTAGSANAAIEALRKSDFDLMLVDLMLPMRNGENAISDGGERLLRQVARGTELRRPSFIIGLTAFSELAANSQAAFHSHGWALVQYSPESSDWEGSVVNQCRHIKEVKRRIQQRRDESRADLCIVTALSDIELQAVFRAFPALSSTVIEGDSSRYAEGTVDCGSRTLRLVACACPEMGNAASASLTTKMIWEFNPKVILLVGICAGISAEIGDIAVAEVVLHYESGKWTEGEGGESVFKPEPRYRTSSGSLLEAIRRYKLQHDAEIRGIPSSWPVNTGLKAPTVCIGPVASGAAVIENRTIVSDLKYRDRKLVALEMESYGVYLAASHCRTTSPEFAMIKAVCDRAVPPKNDKYQEYAGFLSAEFARRFVVSEAQVAGGVFR